MSVILSAVASRLSRERNRGTGNNGGYAIIELDATFLKFFPDPE